MQVLRKIVNRHFMRDEKCARARVWSHIVLFQARNSKSECANDRMNILAKWQLFRETVSFEPLCARFHSSIRICACVPAVYYFVRVIPHTREQICIAPEMCYFAHKYARGVITT